MWYGKLRDQILSDVCFLGKAVVVAGMKWEPCSLKVFQIQRFCNENRAEHWKSSSLSLSLQFSWSLYTRVESFPLSSASGSLSSDSVNVIKATCVVYVFSFLVFLEVPLRSQNPAVLLDISPLSCNLWGILSHFVLNYCLEKWSTNSNSLRNTTEGWFVPVYLVANLQISDNIIKYNIPFFRWQCHYISKTENWEDKNKWNEENGEQTFYKFELSKYSTWGCRLVLSLN